MLCPFLPFDFLVDLGRPMKEEEYPLSSDCKSLTLIQSHQQIIHTPGCRLGKLSNRDDLTYEG
jgi:hypothetical protein